MRGQIPLSVLWILANFVTPAALAEEPPQDEYAIEFVEYRALPELGQIQINDGVVRGKQACERVQGRAGELAERGVFTCSESETHAYTRTEKMSGHTIETLVAIDPPSAEAEEDDDADWTRRVVVLVDGRKKVDCTLGASPDGDILVYGIAIHADEGTVEAVAVTADGIELVVPAEESAFDNATVITNDSFAEVGPEESAPAEDGPVRI